MMCNFALGLQSCIILRITSAFGSGSGQSGSQNSLGRCVFVRTASEQREYKESIPSTQKS